MNLFEWGSSDDYTPICTSNGLVPLAILSQDEENFVQTFWDDLFTLPVYIGLHQDSKGNWVWYDDNMKEFSVGNFSFEKRTLFSLPISTGVPDTR